MSGVSGSDVVVAVSGGGGEWRWRPRAPPQRGVDAEAEERVGRAAEERGQRLVQRGEHVREDQLVLRLRADHVEPHLRERRERRGGVRIKKTPAYFIFLGSDLFSHH